MRNNFTQWEYLKLQENINYPPSVPGLVGGKPEATKSRQVHQPMKAILPLVLACDQTPSLSQTAALPPMS